MNLLPEVCLGPRSNPLHFEDDPDCGQDPDHKWCLDMLIDSDIITSGGGGLEFPSDCLCFRLQCGLTNY